MFFGNFLWKTLNLIISRGSLSLWSIATSLRGRFLIETLLGFDERRNDIVVLGGCGFETSERIILKRLMDNFNKGGWGNPREMIFID